MIPVFAIVALACGGGVRERGSGRRAGLDVAIERAPHRDEDEGEDEDGDGDGHAAPLVARPPHERRAGDLVVHSPPDPRPPPFGGRMRADVDGALTAGTTRTWVGIDVPIFVELAIGQRELFVLDHGPDGWLALHRAPMGTPECDGIGPNCAWTTRLYADDGSVKWTLELNPLLSRRDHLEVQDVRIADGVLYFNEACQSYSREAGGRCSALVAVNPTEGRVLWRTPPLTSNNVFLVTERYIVCGYGFTAEPDHLFVVRRSDGRIVARANLPSAHEDMQFVAPTTLEVRVYPGQTLAVLAEGFEGDHPRLVVPPLQGRPPAPRRAPEPEP